MRTALTSVPWVREVKIDFDRKQATVTAIAERYDLKVLLNALEKAGYPGKVVKEGP